MSRHLIYTKDKFTINRICCGTPSQKKLSYRVIGPARGIQGYSTHFNNLIFKGTDVIKPILYKIIC